MDLPASRVASFLFALVAILGLAAPAFGQAASADYTDDLPSVDRVKAEIKGTDPTDTLARQTAVFSYLNTYVYRIAYNRSVRGPYTAGETRVMTAYQLAGYQITQDYTKSHTPEQAKAFVQLAGQYEMNSAFYADWSKRLIGPQSAAAYKNAENQLQPASEPTSRRNSSNTSKALPRSNLERAVYPTTPRRSPRAAVSNWAEIPPPVSARESSTVSSGWLAPIPSCHRYHRAPG